MQFSNEQLPTYLLRQKCGNTNINMFYYLINFLFPALRKAIFSSTPSSTAPPNSSARRPEFDDLAAEVGLGSHHNGVTDPQQRAKLRAELDGIIAHIYGLTEEEFSHVLSTFPLVDESVKAAALQAWHDVADGVVH